MPGPLDREFKNERERQKYIKQLQKQARLRKGETMSEDDPHRKYHIDGLGPEGDSMRQVTKGYEDRRSPLRGLRSAGILMVLLICLFLFILVFTGGLI